MYLEYKKYIMLKCAFEKRFESLRRAKKTWNRRAEIIKRNK